MSHYTCLLILNKEEEINEATIDKRLTPFYEGLEVEPYKESCGCIGHKAYRESLEMAEMVTGTNRNKLRDDYSKLPRDDRPSWEDFIKEFNDKFDSIFNQHPLKTIASEDCNECEGTGVVESTYNPNSKWDWFEIGGRWDGSLVDKKGNKVNYGKLSDLDFEKLKEVRKQDAEETWEKAIKEDGQMKRFLYGIDESTKKEDYIKSNETFSCFSVLDENGVWHERGKMGWFASVSDEQETPQEWNAKFFERFIKDLAPENKLVIIDCHI